MQTEARTFRKTVAICFALHRDYGSCSPGLVEELYPNHYRKWKKDKEFITFLEAEDGKYYHQKKMCEVVFGIEERCTAKFVKKHFPNFYKKAKRSGYGKFHEFLYNEDERKSIELAEWEDLCYDFKSSI